MKIARRFAPEPQYPDSNSFIPLLEPMRSWLPPILTIAVRRC